MITAVQVDSNLDIFHELAFIGDLQIQYCIPLDVCGGLFLVSQMYRQGTSCLPTACYVIFPANAGVVEVLQQKENL